MGCLSKKVSGSAVLDLCLFWQPAGPGCAGGLPSSASLTVCPLCAVPPPSPTPHFISCYEGLHFNASIFLKGMGYLRCRLYMWISNSCSPGDGPSQAGCESAPLMAGLVVFSPVHQQLISYGGQQESLGFCRIFHLRKFVQGTETWLFCGRVSWPHQQPDAWEVQSACAWSLVLFFHILPASIWQLITPFSVIEGLYQCIWEQFWAWPCLDFFSPCFWIISLQCGWAQPRGTP